MKEKKIFVSVFDNYFAKQSNVDVNLLDWFIERNEFTPVVEIIRSISDKSERNRLKAKLPAITPSGIFSERKVDKLIKHSGIICIDIDGKDNPHILDFEGLKSELATIKNILFCALSVSGKGLFCFIQIAYPEKHKEHFYALQEDFKDKGIVIDKGCSDVCRLRGYSFDNNPYINLDAEIFYSTIEKKMNMKEKSHAERSTLKIKQGELTPQKEPFSIESSFFKPTLMDHIQVVTQTKTDIVRELLSRVIESKVDITDEYGDWFKICCIIKNLFGEDGRSMFHEISSFSSKYYFEIADRKYSSFKKGDYFCNSNDLIEIMVRFGLY